MIIKNLTPQTQKVVVKEWTEDRKTYDIYLMPYGSTDCDKVNIVNLHELAGKVEIEGTPKIPLNTAGVTVPAEIPVVETEDTAEETQEGEEQSAEELPPVEGAHICDICGAEFASARGLNSHKNRAHGEDN